MPALPLASHVVTHTARTDARFTQCKQVQSQHICAKAQGCKVTLMGMDVALACVYALQMM